MHKRPIIRQGESGGNCRMNTEHWEPFFIPSITYSLKQALIEEKEKSYALLLGDFHPGGDHERQDL